MKSSVYKLFIITAILKCSFLNVFSQENNFLGNECLWMKSINRDTLNCLQNFSNKNELEKNHFNFNEPIDFLIGQATKKIKRIVSKSSSLFIVFRSDSKEETPLLYLKYGSNKTILTNQKLINDKKVMLNKGNSRTGILLSYMYNKNSFVGRKNGSIIFDESLFDNSKKYSQIAELIYIPRFVSKNEKEIIETYMSLKYGISLSDGNNYFNSDGEKIWDINQNIGFNFNITGIGNDMKTSLNQKQSKNSLNKFLTIGLDKIMVSNCQNESELKDKEFLIWGDNGKSMELEDDNSIKKMKRVWKINPISNEKKNFVTQIKLDKIFMQVQSQLDNNDVWMVIDSVNTKELDYKKAKYIKASINNESEVVFDNVEFNSTEKYLFSFVKAKKNEIISMISLSDEILHQKDISELRKNDILIYPNPVSANEKFNIQFNLSEASDVEIQINDINGKILRAKSLGLINKHLFTDSLSISGTYLIIISINGKIETTKIIVK